MEHNSLDVRIDRSKPLEVAGGPPGVCPLCGFRFSGVIRPPRRLQAKAKLLIAIGFGLTLLWALFLGVAFVLATSQSDFVIIPMNKFSAGVAAIVVAAPAYLLGAWAMKPPRVVKLSCRQCDWRDTFLVDKRGQTVLSRKLNTQ
jgi:hypothetical protein